MEQCCLICHVPLEDDLRPWICGVCVVRLEWAVQGLPGLYVGLHVELPLGTRERRLDRLTSRTPWRSRELSTPLRLSLLEHASRCVDAIRHWGLRAVPDSIPAEPVRPGYLLQTVCAALEADLSRAVRTEENVVRARKVWTAYARARRLLGREEPPRRLKTACPSCHLRALISADGGAVVCRSCTARWPAGFGGDPNPRAGD